MVERDRHEGWIGRRKAHPLLTLFSRVLGEGKQRYETEEDNGVQINESVGDIMNSHTLMRPIYCRHQQ